MKPFIKLSNDWSQWLDSPLSEPYTDELVALVDQKYSKTTVYPEKEQIFNALNSYVI